MKDEYLTKQIPEVGQGNGIFISRSKPYEKDGKQVYRFAMCVNKQRQAKLALMRGKGLTGKQFRAWAKLQRKAELQKAA